MPDGFQIDNVPSYPVFGGWAAANQGLSDIGAGIGQWARQQQALRLAEQQRQNDLQDQIKLLTIKAQLENQYNPFSRIKENVSLASNLDQLGQLTPELEKTLLGGIPGYSSTGSGVGMGMPVSTEYSPAPDMRNRVEQVLTGGLPNGLSLMPRGSFTPNPQFNPMQNQIVPTEFSASGRAKGFKLKPASEKLDEMKIQDELKANEEKVRLIKSSAVDTLGTIAEIEKGMKFFGPFGDIPTFPGMPHYAERKNWEVNTNKLIAEKVLKVLNDMKAASKTGATGFGQLSNKELGLLQNAATALKKSLGREDAQRYLNQIKTSMSKISGEQSFSQFQEGQRATNPATGEKIIFQGGQWQPIQ